MLSLLLGCASPQVPRDSSIVAPATVVQLKERYESKPADTASQEATSDDFVSTDQGEEKRAGNYILGPGDQLTIVIQRVPNASYDIMIRPDGYISLPRVDEVEAAGLTPAQLDERLTQLYSTLLVDPDLSVIVRSFRQPMVYVLGKVASPGPIPFREAASAAEAIARAGDMLPTADASKITIIRLTKDGVIRPIVVESSLGQAANQYQITPYMVLAATQLEPEDVLFIPEHGMAKLGSDIESMLKPLTATGTAASSLLNPVLIWKFLGIIDRANNVNISP